MIWDGVLFKFIVSFDVMVIRKKVFLEFSCCIYKHLDMFVEVIEVHISVAFELCLEEWFIAFW